MHKAYLQVSNFLKSKAEVSERIGLFIDSGNFIKSVKGILGKRHVNFVRLLFYFEATRERICEAFYYVGRRDNRDDGKISFLESIGYTVRSKPSRWVEEDGIVKPKADFDGWIYRDVRRLLKLCKLDRVVLFSGDGHFKELIEEIYVKGAFPEIVSTRKKSKTYPNGVLNGKLFRAACRFGEFTELATISGYFAK